MQFKNGIDIGVVSKLLGHANEMITRTVYIHLESLEMEKIKVVNL